MGPKHCSFCKKFSSSVGMARICEGCATGRVGDDWCDFCNKTIRTEIAWICPACAKGRVGDDRCDFCNKTTRTAPAKICDRCTA